MCSEVGDLLKIVGEVQSVILASVESALPGVVVAASLVTFSIILHRVLIETLIRHGC